MAGRRKELNETEAFLILETMGQILASQQFRLRHPGAWTESDQAELVGFDSMFKDVIARVQARLGPESPWTT
jgi:hypothetical protein